MSHDRLKQVLDYNPDTGIFTWKVSGARNKAGNRAGHPGPGGRWVIGVDGTVYYGTRLAWFYVKGEWPTSMIVQKGGIKPEVVFADLEEKTHSELRQADGLNSLNKSGIKGVSWSKTAAKWLATITRDGRQHYLGKFDTKEAAAAAYDRAAAGSLPGNGSRKDPNWLTSRRQRSAQWKDIQFNPAIVGWETVEQFLADVGAPPSVDHVLMRERYKEPLGPGNAKWRLPWSKRDGHEEAPAQSYNLGLNSHQYEITAVEYARLHAEQGGLCAICKRPEKTTHRNGTRRLAVDHSHDHGRVRALLCANCNNGLGRFEDDPVRLRAAADYIERHAQGRR